MHSDEYRSDELWSRTIAGKNCSQLELFRRSAYNSKSGHLVLLPCFLVYRANDPLSRLSNAGEIQIFIGKRESVLSFSCKDIIYVGGISER